MPLKWKWPKYSKIFKNIKIPQNLKMTKITLKPTKWPKYPQKTVKDSWKLFFFFFSSSIFSSVFLANKQNYAPFGSLQQKIQPLINHKITYWESCFWIKLNWVGYLSKKTNLNSQTSEKKHKAKTLSFVVSANPHPNNS